jgi:hypothetical protein
MADKIITQEYLREIFDYKDGHLYWKKRTSIRITIGKKVGYLSKDGRIYTRINKKLVGLHRVIFAYHHGYFPKLVDHIDRNCLNNSIENLREATKSQNAFNSKIASNNKSGVKGICWHKNAKKWHTRIVVGKKIIVSSFFENLSDAENFVKKMRKIHHKEFACHG